MPKEAALAERAAWQAQPPLVVLHVGIFAGVKSIFIASHLLSQAQRLYGGSFIAGISHHYLRGEVGVWGENSKRIVLSRIQLSLRRR